MLDSYRILNYDKGYHSDKLIKEVKEKINAVALHFNYNVSQIEIDLDNQHDEFSIECATDKDEYGNPVILHEIEVVTKQVAINNEKDLDESYSEEYKTDNIMTVHTIGRYTKVTGSNDFWFTEM